MKWQKYPIANVKFVWHLIWIFFVIFIPFCHKISNSKSFPKPNVKPFLNWQMEIFCHFMFCQNRRNGFWIIGPSGRNAGMSRKWNFSFVLIFFTLQWKTFLILSFICNYGIKNREEHNLVIVRSWKGSLWLFISSVIMVNIWTSFIKLKLNSNKVFGSLLNSDPNTVHAPL